MKLCELQFCICCVTISFYSGWKILTGSAQKSANPIRVWNRKWFQLPTTDLSFFLTGTPQLRPQPSKAEFEDRSCPSCKSKAVPLRRLFEMLLTYPASFLGGYEEHIGWIIHSHTHSKIHYLSTGMTRDIHVRWSPEFVWRCKTRLLPINVDIFFGGKRMKRRSY